MKLTQKRRGHKYRQLLIVLIVSFFISPFLTAKTGSILTALMLLYTIVVIVKSFALPSILVSLYLAVAVVAFGLQVAASLEVFSLFNRSVALFAEGVFSLYLGGAAYWIGRDLFETPEVTADTVQGGISVYLLIGFVWALFYGMVATVDVQAFSQPLAFQGSYLRPLHFSFTTLTTLGYGDIVPTSEIALVLTNLEAILGQMYPAIFISILVGGYLSQRSS